MIKFVCTGCGERLSVPDAHAGRKGVCPNCHAINRIPLKGMPQAAQSKSPAPQPTSAPALSEIAAPGEPLDPPSFFPVGQQEIAGPENYASEAAPPTELAEMVELQTERRLPKPVKITLLILAALALVGSLYFGLLFALHAMIAQPG